MILNHPGQSLSKCLHEGNNRNPKITLNRRVIVSKQLEGSGCCQTEDREMKGMSLLGKFERNYFRDCH